MSMANRIHPPRRTRTADGPVNPAGCSRVIAHNALVIGHPIRSGGVDVPAGTSAETRSQPLGWPTVPNRDSELAPVDNTPSLEPAHRIACSGTGLSS